MADPAANRAATTTLARPGAMPEVFETFETQLSRDLDWALTQGSLFFEDRGAVQDTLRRITRRLDELGVPYAVIGGMALYLHGYRRFTEDVDIVVSRGGLNLIHEHLARRGYVRNFEGSRSLRDCESGVRIDFCITGQFPRDGTPKAIAFPDPSEVVETLRGVRVVNLAQLISLKLASGISNDRRLRDLSDIEELIQTRRLPKSLADSLHPYCQEAYIGMWNRLDAQPIRYLRLWPHMGLSTKARSIDDLIDSSSDSKDVLKAMRDAGVTLDTSWGSSAVFVHLVTESHEVATRFEFHPESEYWDLGRYDGETGDVAT